MYLIVPSLLWVNMYLLRSGNKKCPEVVKQQENKDYAKFSATILIQATESCLL